MGFRVASAPFDRQWVTGRLVTTAALSLALLLSADAGLAAAQAEPTRTVSGTVARFGSGQPVARARVTLSDVESDPGGTASVTTDSSGHFAFPNVKPGSYTLTASRDGYLMAEYGQRRSGKRSAPLIVEPGQSDVTVVITIVPTGAITGHVYDSYGDPVVNATVQAFRYTYEEGRRGLTAVQTVRSNDIGEYRLFWMQPGRYVVRASTSSGRQTGTGTSPRRRDEVPVVQSSQPPLTYSPTYFPGVMDPAAASLIDLTPGTELPGIDFLLMETRAVRIAGSVTDGLTGQPAPGASVSLVSRLTEIRGANDAPSSTTSGPGGSFEFRDVPPGSYELVARTGASSRSGAIGDLDVWTADFEGVALTLRPAFGVAGRIYADFASGAGDPRGLAAVAVQLQPAIAGLPTASAKVNADGSFVASGVLPGEYRLRVTQLPRGTYVKSARLGSNDLLVSATRLLGSAQDAIEVVLGDDAAALEALVVDRGTRPVVDTRVVLVPEETLRNRADLYYSASTNSDGRVRIEGIQPGNYTIFTSDDIQAGAWFDPELLRGMEARGVPAALRGGATGQVTLDERTQISKADAGLR